MAGKNGTIVAVVLVLILLCTCVVLQVLGMRKASRQGALLVETQQELQRLRDTCAKGEAIKRVEAELDAVRTLCTTLQTGLDGSSKSLRECNTAVAAIETRLATQQADLQNITKDSGKSTKSVQALQKQVEALASLGKKVESLQAVRGELTGLQNVQKEQDKVIAALKQAGIVEDQTDDEQGGLKDGLRTLRNQMMREEMTRLRKTVDESQREVGKTHAQVKKSITDADEEFRKQLTEFRAETKRLRSTLDTIGGMSRELEAKTASLREEITKYLSKAFYNSPWELADSTPAPAK